MYLPSQNKEHCIVLVYCIGDNGDNSDISDNSENRDNSDNNDNSMRRHTGLAL